MAVGTAILACRLKRGLTQARLAERALVTPANLSAIETGRRDLTVGTLLRIARALDVPAADLLSPSHTLRVISGRFTPDAIARATITGERNLPPEQNRLADGLAWICRPGLQATGAPGARRGARTAWRLAETRWDPDLLDRLQARVRKLLPVPESTAALS
jgi:transcriptional regulator with XRE-family HTH domain